MRLLGVKFRKLSHNKAWLLRFVWVFKIAILGFKIQCGLPSLGILAIAVPVPSLAKTENLSLGHNISDNSERLFQRGKEGSQDI